MTRRKVHGTNAIHRAFALLREVAAHNRDGLRLADIAERFALETPTAHRVLKSLLVEGVLRRDDATKRYRLGPTLFELGAAATPAVDLKKLCDPALARLARQTGDTAFLTQRSGYDAVCLTRMEGSFPVKTFTLEVGMRRPLGVGAGSLAILSALPKAEIDEVLHVNAPRLKAYDELTVAALASQIRRTQKLGHSVRDLRGLGGVRTIGVAIRDRAGMPQAALSLSAIKPRMKEDRLAELAQLLKREAQEIERELASLHDAA